MSAALVCVGGEDHALRIPFLLALRRRGFRIAAAGTGDPRAFESAGIDYWPYRFDRFLNPLADVAGIRALKAILDTVRPNIAQSFDTKPNILLPIAARNATAVRVVRTINGLGWIYSSRSPLALGLRSIYPGMQRLAARATAATVFQNRHDQDFFEQRRIATGIASRLIAGSGVDVERFEAALVDAPSREAVRKDLNLDKREIVITVTRLTRQKGISTLLQAAHLIDKRRPGVSFLLVGPRESEGSQAVSEATIVRHRPYVIALGERRDVPALLRAADVFAFPTEYREGVPRALLEAALAGLPIVATNMPGCDEIIEDGWNGWLVPPRSPRVLADRIVGLLQDRAEAAAMGVRAADVARRRFSLEATVERYAALYAELLERFPRSTSPARATAQALPS